MHSLRLILLLLSSVRDDLDYIKVIMGEWGG